MQNLQEPKILRPNKTRIYLMDGRELQYHKPRERVESVDLKSLIPNEFATAPLEVEIGPGKGEFLAGRAALYPNRFFVGIDRRMDRYLLTEKKLQRLENMGRNSIILREDARSFIASTLPPIQALHIYQPDPWPKARHHKHRFFRSPDAKTWADAIVSGGALCFSTDHQSYFEEILEIVMSWKTLDLAWVWKKESVHGKGSTYFENIFLRKNEPVFKAIFSRK